MPILTGLGVTAAVTTVSYLGPLIISCVVSGISIIITFISTRAFYKEEKEQNTEYTKLKKDQKNRDLQLRKEIEKIAYETGIDLQVLLNLSKEQRLEIKKALDSFTQNIVDSAQATLSLNQIVSKIQITTNDALMQNSVLHKELDIIKSELKTIRDKLSKAEQKLANKEKDLNITINKLKLIEEKLSLTTSSSVLTGRFTTEPFCAHPANPDDDKNPSLLSQNNLDICRTPVTNNELNNELNNEKNKELNNLRKHNLALSNTIETLKNSISNLETKLTKTTIKENEYLSEIQNLIAENKQLTKTIEDLAAILEQQNKQASLLTTNTKTHLRLFK